MYNFGSSILTQTSITNYNRYHSHTKHCKHCQNVLRIGNILKYITPPISLFAIAYWPVPFSLVLYLILDHCANSLINITKGSSSTLMKQSQM